jgi:hypothetical protein
MEEFRKIDWKFADLERPRGLEPPPTAWQAVVLPLYYGRFAHYHWGDTCFYSMSPKGSARARHQVEITFVRRHNSARSAALCGWRNG